MHKSLILFTLFMGVFATVAVSAQPSTTTKAVAGKKMTQDIFVISVRQGNTDLGKIELVLWPDVAPKHAEFFAARVAEGWYNKSAFHRVIPGFMIQGGDPNSKSQPRNTWGTGGYPEKVQAEFSNKRHVRGVLSAARTNDPNSFSGQFFICVADATFLDGQYTAFGEVVKGMEVVDQIVSAPRDQSDNPFEKIEMTIVKKGS